MRFGLGQLEEALLTLISSVSLEVVGNSCEEQLIRQSFRKMRCSKFSCMG